MEPNMSEAQTASAPETPPHAVLLQMLTGKWVSTMISTLARFGVADHLESGPKSPKELAELVGAQERALYRLMRAAASLGVFTELEDGRFANTALSEPLRTNAVPCIRNMALMMLDDYHANSWAELPWCVETGKPAPYKLFGMGGFEWFAQNPEQSVNFHHAMSDLSQADSPVIASSYDFSQFASIMDVAGGLGTLLAAILARTPELRGTLFEVPPVAEKARQSPILAPYKDRVEFIGRMRRRVRFWITSGKLLVRGANCWWWSRLCRPATNLGWRKSWIWKCWCCRAAASEQSRSGKNFSKPPGFGWTR